MRSNPFATFSFGKKTEQRRDEPLADAPRIAPSRAALAQPTPARHAGLDGARLDPAPPAPDAAPGRAVSANTPKPPDAPVDADTLATLRSWGLPDGGLPGDGSPAAAANPEPVSQSTPKSRASEGFGGGAMLDRLREELGADSRSLASRRNQADGLVREAEPDVRPAADEPVDPARAAPDLERAAADAAGPDDAPAHHARPAFGHRIEPQREAVATPAPAVSWGHEEEEDLDDIAVTIGRVVSIRGSVIWGALFDDADGTTARAARMGALVSMRGPDSRVFGIVNGLQREQQGGNQAERTIFEVQVLGELATAVPESAAGFQRGVSSYPPLDAPVTTVTLRDLAKVYARPRMSNVHIGRLRHNRKVPAFVLTDSLLGKHFAVLGTTGAGKSCAVTVILRSILDEHPHGHVILLDPHNEYAKAFADKAELLNPSNLQLPYWLLNFEEIAHVLMGGQGNEHSFAQTAILKDAILRVKKLFAGENEEDGFTTVDTPIPYRLSDLTAALKEGMGMLNKAERSSSPYLNLIARIESLRIDRRYAFMFASIAVRDTMRQVLAQLLRIPVDGKPITIIDISGMPSEIVDVVVSVLFRLMFELAIWSERGAAPPMLLVCEEAHRYVPQEDGAGFAPTKRVISRIAKEGRKYGITLCLVSQRPSELSMTSLSQCNTVFALRLSNEHDQAFVARALSENARWLVDSLPSLNTQEAVVVGDGVTVPVHIRFKDLPREHRPSSFDRSFSTAWRADADPQFLDRTIDRWRRQVR
jgi:DNA helicase HerA-like ATPase